MKNLFYYYRSAKSFYIVCLLLVCSIAHGYGKGPNNNYASPRIFNADAAIKTLHPTRTDKVPTGKTVSPKPIANSSAYLITNNPPSNNDNLGNLTLNLARRVLTPAFSPTRLQYGEEVGNPTNTVTFTPTTAVSSATLKVNGTTVVSGTALTYPLAVGLNTFNIAVTAEDGVTTKTYTLSITRDLPSNSNLSNLTISTGTLTPAFAANTYYYTASVPNATTSVTVTPTSSYYQSTITVNGDSVTSKTASAAIPLLVGNNNTISIVVTAPNGSRALYKVTVTRAQSSDPNLADLGDLRDTLFQSSPAFSPATINYTSSVRNSIRSVAVTPIAAAVGATITVNGVSVPSGTWSGWISLKPGTNTISIVVTSQNGSTTKTYTVTISRETSSFANLTQMHISPGVLSPAFSGSTFNYTAQVANGVTSVTVTAQPGDADATITVNGSPTPPSTPSASQPLAVGPNTINVVVTASDGTTTDTYTITVTRSPSSNANINHLALSSGTLSPTFAQATTSYTASVANSVSSITLTPKTTDPTATITVNGTPVASGTASDPVALSVGSNVITMVGHAQDSVTTKTYTITVTREAAGPANSALDAIGVTSPAERPQLQREEITVHQGVSPNGDGVNDFLLIEGISNYPDNRLTIMNRAGQVVFEAKSYDNSTKVFDGHSNKTGAMQLPGTYFYSLDYSVKGVIKHKTGYIVLKY